MKHSAPEREQTPPRRRILFVAEAVTLAHVARPVALAQSLDPTRHEVRLACAPRYDELLGPLPFPRRPIRSIPGEQFLRALSRGAPLYDAATLRDYVREDLEVLGEMNPDLVVGDFRLSLSVSARLRGIPYVTISNAYWSPYARQRFPMPELPFVKYLGVTVGRCFFGMVRPLAFAYHTLPLNRVRREHGLPALGHDLRRVYTDADHTLYADVPDLVPTVNLPPNHHYLGPVLWEPAVERPAWWDDLPGGRPVVYVTLGSSGQSALLPAILSALADLPVTMIAATAGRINLREVPRNTWAADFLPGSEAAGRASLVVCNGGSPATYQALTAGTPVLGIASNMDQYLNMGAVQQAGAGELLRAGKADAATVRNAVERMLAAPEYAAAARSLAEVLACHHAPTRFRALVNHLLADVPPDAEAVPTEGQSHEPQRI